MSSTDIHHSRANGLLSSPGDPTKPAEQAAEAARRRLAARTVLRYASRLDRHGLAAAVELLEILGLDAAEAREPNVGAA